MWVSTVEVSWTQIDFKLKLCEEKAEEKAK